MTTGQTWEVAAERLDGRYNPASLPFVSTSELAPFQGVLGQERAVRAIEFGLGMREAGYHMYAAGPDGLGKTTIVCAFLTERAAQMRRPTEWAFVHNFDDPDSPLALPFPPGAARPFAMAISTALRDLIVELREVFGSDSYARQRQQLAQHADTERSRLLTEVQRQAEKLGFRAEFTPQGLVTVAIVNGEPLSAEDVDALPTDQQRAIEAANGRLREIVSDVFLRMRALEREANRQVRDLDEDVAASTIDRHLDPVIATTDSAEPTAQFVTRLKAHLAQSHQQFLATDDTPPWANPGGRKTSLTRQYEVNVLGVSDGQLGAPVIVESNPTYQNLIGRIDYAGQFGTLLTNHMMIRPGSLLRANGGFLVLLARDLLANPLAYQALKRSLTERAVQIENLSDQFGLVSASGLRPDRVPLDVQVVIVGDRELQGAFYRFDPEFRELFRVHADFDTELERTDANVVGVARLIRAQREEAQVRDATVEAVAALVRHSSRLAEDQRHLTANLGSILDLVKQANFWAGQEAAAEIDGTHIDLALQQQTYRSAFQHERINDLMNDGTIHVETSGAQVGQINALSTIDLGDTLFGQPSRVTCVTSAGQGRLVAIERETHQAGPVHDKGFLTLRGYLADRFGQRRAMMMDGSLTFEQMYGSIEGDSASSSELYAVLSSLSGVPVSQRIAVTGAVDQRGEVLAVGGVSAKIEGFYDLCQRRGLDGEQGVLIPSANVLNVVLRGDVIAAIEAGRFHVWAVDCVEDGIEVLTGCAAGQRGKDGRYPHESIFGRIEARLELYERDSVSTRVAAAESVVPGRSAELPVPLGLPAPPPPAPPTRVISAVGSPPLSSGELSDKGR